MIIGDEPTMLHCSAMEVSIMSMTTPPRIADTAPPDPHMTAYDHAHVEIYLRLLDAAAEGAPWEEVCSIVLGIDPGAAPQHARQCYESHLARAHWLSEIGYRDLLKAPE